VKGRGVDGALGDCAGRKRVVWRGRVARGGEMGWKG